AGNVHRGSLAWQPVRVPGFEPFRALRYAPDRDLDRVSAPPYDVIDEHDVARLLSVDPDNIVAVDFPLEANGPGRYDAAAATLHDWVERGVLVADPTPSFTLYRMQFRDETGTERETVGVLGALEVVDEGAGGVLPHERTTPKAKTDRLDLTIATEANLSPVWGLSLAAGLTDVLREPGEAMGRCTDEEGVVHIVERVDDPARVAAIRAAVSSAAVVIADGHHRYAISRTYRDRQRGTTGRDDLESERTLTYVGELVADQLSVAAIHRLVRGVSADELIAGLDACFDAAPAGTVTPAFARTVVERGALCVVHPDGSGTWLTPRPGAFDGVRDLDSARLEHALAALPAAEISYQHGVAHIVDAVTSGRADAGVLIRPVSIAEIRRTADEGALMPPKSTFFSPKLRTGLVIRPLH
ncbi:MAG TPA: DUF1015 domain-containing protein, partial [Ilumatobacteraceae bacterium]|nr:DUF1015 domain-containing protein [Ilumatobacteraceae bacterium]